MNHVRAQVQHAVRDVPESRDRNPSMNRDAFVVDRDRILQSKAFRRMRGKTQVFVSSLDDHIRTRLTHTLEVAQIARSIGRAVGLNETLIEAAAYGHDLGHTPYGHIGERTLHHICSGELPLSLGLRQVVLRLGGFKHNVQSLRQVSQLESHQTAWEDGEERFQAPIGLNLTKQTRWAMVVHTGIGYKDGPPGVSFYEDELHRICTGFSLEALVVALADEIAQQHHDLVDGFVAGLVTEGEVHAVLKPLLNAHGPKTYEAFELQLAAAKELCRRTGELSRLGAVISRHTANSLVSIGLEYLKKAMARFKEAFEASGGTLGQYNLAPDDETWEKTLLALDGEPDKWSEHPLGYPYGVIDKLSQTQEGLRWVDPEFWPGDVARNLCEMTLRRVIFSQEARRMDGKAQFLVRRLVAAYLRTPGLLPTKTLASIGSVLGLELKNDYRDLAQDANEVLGKSVQRLVEPNLQEQVVVGRETSDKSQHVIEVSVTAKNDDARTIANFARVIVDHVAGMTDNYASAEHARLYDAGSKI